MTALNNPDLVATLRALAIVLKDAQDDWWIIGSAAVALHGGDPGEVADVDVITSRRDLEALHTALPLANTPETGKPIFSSELFGVWSEPPLPVEFMTGLKVRSGLDWRDVGPQTREAVSVAGETLFIPEREELIAILRSFGRAKDLRRAATLAQ